MATIDELPIEVLSIIFEYVGARYRKNCTLVCKKWLFAKRCPAFYHTMRCTQQTMIGLDLIDDFLSSYRPYCSLVFYGVENFTSYFLDNYEDSPWMELTKIKELKFIGCRGFFDKTLDLILQHLPKVQKLTVIERTKFPWLVMKFPHITTLDLSKVAIALPKVLINTLDCFPALNELIIADTFLWQELDIEIGELCSLVPKVCLSFENYFVPLNDSILSSFSDILNLEIWSIRVSQTISKAALECFLAKKGLTLKYVEIFGTLEESYLRLLNLFCLKLDVLVLKLSSEPHYNPLTLIKDVLIQEIQISTEEMVNLFLEPTFTFPATKTLSLTGLTFYDEFFLNHFPILNKLIVMNFTSPLKIPTTVHVLKLDNGDLNDDILETMGLFQLINVEELLLQGKCTDKSIQKFSSWPTLTKLSLIKSDISLTGLKELCIKCRHLESLTLKGCFNIEDGGAKVIANNLKDLKEIDLTGTSITEYAAKYFQNTNLKEQVLKIARLNIASRRKSLIKELKFNLQERKSN